MLLMFCLLLLLETIGCVAFEIRDVHLHPIRDCEDTILFYVDLSPPVPNFQSNSVLNQEVFQKQFSTDSESVLVTLGSEIL